MDELFSIFFFGGVVLFVLFGPWVILAVSSKRRRRERAEEQHRWESLQERVRGLERAVETVQKARPADAQPVSASVAEAPIAPAAPAAAEVAPEPVPSAPSDPAEPSFVSQAEEVAEARLATPDSLPSPPPSPPVAAYPPPAFPPPQFGEVEHAATFSDRFKSSGDLEETLGTNWLNKLGVGILVLGVAFFLAYQLKTLGPAGKVLVGYVVSIALLGAGTWFERNERYRILARAGIGGGWAMLFFTTYAMYHVPAAHVLSSQALDLVLMLAVAAAMVWHTLRYRSQVVTGLAFLLAFLTVTISHSTVYSLAAGAVLAAGLVVIISRMQWFELEIFGMLASYFNHYLWLRPIIEPMHGHRKPFPEFAASAGILALYWVIFRLSYVLRKPREEWQEHVSTAAGLLNTALLLALFKYQSVHPQWAFWALLAIGAIELALGQLPITRRRRSAVIVLSTLGVVLLVAALPFRYSGMRLSVLWLFEAEALFLIGVWTREVVFRRLGLMALAVVAGQMISVDAAQVAGMRMDGAYVHSDFPLALIFLAAAGLFYVNSHIVFRRWKELFTVEFDGRWLHDLSYAGGVLLLIAAWAAFPESWTAVAWAALGLALALTGWRWKVPQLGYQANGLAILAVVRVLSLNLDAAQKWHGLTLRLITVAATAALLYVTSSWSAAPNLAEEDVPFAAPRWVSGAYTWAASFLLALLAWYELRPVSVSEAWVVGGIVLLELGLAGKNLALRMQAYALLMAGFLRIFFVNLSAAGNPGEISPRFYTVLPMALVFFYAYVRLRGEGEPHDWERKFRVEAQSCYLGTITIAALMRFELPPDWVAAGWAALVFALLAIAWRNGRPIFLHQGLLVALGVLFRTILHNFYQRTYFPAPAAESRWLSVGAVVFLLFASLVFAMKLRRKDDPLTETGLVRMLTLIARRPEQVLFFIGLILLTVLLALETRHGMVTLTWGVEGVAIFLFALWLGERSFRISGLFLLLLCAGKILLVDVWRLNPRDRYLTLIVLGAALLFVSFLYTRHREAMRQYL